MIHIYELSHASHSKAYCLKRLPLPRARDIKCQARGTSGTTRDTVFRGIFEIEIFNRKLTPAQQLKGYCV